MPQPLSRVIKDPGRVTFHHDDLQGQPELAALAMTVISIWSRIDWQTATMFAEATHTNQAFAARLLNSVESATARSALVKTAIREMLGEESLSLYTTIMRSGAGSQSARNDFAHGIWGACEALTSALLLIDSRHYAESSAAISDSLNERFESRNKMDGTALIGLRRLILDRTYVYRKKDFEDLIRDADRVQRALRAFTTLFPSLGRFSIDQVRQRLIDEHLIPLEHENHTDAPKP